MKNNLKLAFYGGVGTTTGANILLDGGDKKIMVDCGLLQGAKQSEMRNFKPFAYDPNSIDFLLITHAHMDHIGRVPKLVREGFNGQIISTQETLELAQPMLQDALRVMQARHKGSTLFELKDIEKALTLWRGYKYGDVIDLGQSCKLQMIDAGHILGSAILSVICGDGEDKKNIVFTGDLGNSPSPLLLDTQIPKDADYLIMESVYGDRNHESKVERRIKLKQAILNGIEKGGTIVIPAFSIERTQVLLYEINNMVEDKEIPTIPVFLDSPLASKVTHIYKKHQDNFKKSVQEEIKNGDDIFDFPNLKIIGRSAESREIENVKGAKIILAGSGMSEGGRVVNHELNYLGDPKATILLVGYQSVGSLGRKIAEKPKEIEIMDNGRREKIKVRATIESIMGYSSHKDSEHLLEFVEQVIDKSAHLKKVFVIMGEPKSSLFLCQRLHDYLDVDAVYPTENTEYSLD
jgi:metallo-beta-lactamase family protein